MDLSNIEAEQADVYLACLGLTLVKVIERLDVEAAQNSQLDFVGLPDQRTINVHESASVLPYTD